MNLSNRPAESGSQFHVLVQYILYMIDYVHVFRFFKLKYTSYTRPTDTRHRSFLCTLATGVGFCAFAPSAGLVHARVGQIL